MKNLKKNSYKIIIKNKIILYIKKKELSNNWIKWRIEKIKIILAGQRTEWMDTTKVRDGDATHPGVYFNNGNELKNQKKYKGKMKFAK